MRTPTLIGLFILYFCHSCIALNPVIVRKQEMWVSRKEGEFHTYRTPILVTVPTGDLLAFSAPRKYTSSDKSAKTIALRRSVDGGLRWSTTQIIEDDYNVTDGLNLGLVIVDQDTNMTFVFFGYCLHTPGKCQSPYRSQGVYFKTSPDWGYTWTPAVNVGDTNADLKGITWAPGPGFGIQKRLEPNKGRLIGCGHSVVIPIRKMQCIYSDDHGKTWYMNSPIYGIPYNQKHIPGDFTPGETQVIELPNGNLLATVRNENRFHCHCRLQALSVDGGQTFPVPYLTVEEALVDPSVFGSLALVNDALFLSHPRNADARVNMTLQWSTDFGKSWPYEMQVYNGSSEYSSLTRIDDHNLGLLFERDGYQTIEFYKIQL